MIYFLKPVGSAGPIKIGCSVYPKHRMECIARAIKIELEMLCEVPGGFVQERALHARFSDSRVVPSFIPNDRNYKASCPTEWFCLSAELQALIRETTKRGALPAIEAGSQALTILKMRSEGRTFKQIGEALGFSKQRAHQIASELQRTPTSGTFACTFWSGGAA